ncbi:ABC transporter permease [Streptomyces sp. QL37]|uniref:ABC transporter permease n=1 Tax=Streptomyces sp. QL37 TaxID=2093747 RepID=UPI000CF1DAE0|nr:ABC transporter permease [Streptomyces sp. QL37]PPQ60242.1 ABC transporter permease [Streptomyces sp. QL37]
MSSASFAVSDSMTMLRRSLRHGIRYPVMLVSSLATPIILLLMFVYILGGTMGAGMGSGSAGRIEYLNYIAPSMILLTVCYGGGTTAVMVSVDLTEGIVKRFRTMPISRSAVLTGHVIGGTLRTTATFTLVLLVALLMGFRPTAGLVEWFAAFGVLILLAVALTWLSIAFGAQAKSPGGANTAMLPLQLLPLVSSAFVPTDSMPTVVRLFAEYQPFTPIIDTLRGLLMGSEIGNSGYFALGWMIGILLVGFFWASSAFHRRGRG